MSYVRPYAKTYGMNLTSNVFGCDSFPNMDILYAHRNSLLDSFSNWQLSGISRPGAFEGGPATLFSETDSSHLDIFMMTGDGDIWMIKKTSRNPSGLSSAIRLPSPINPVSKEFIADNAFMERIHSDSIILIYEKYVDAAARVFMYTFTSDTGNTWSAPAAITTINNTIGHIEHPCLYKDAADQWWLYFSIDYNYIVRSKQTMKGNWNSWGPYEKIISKGNAISMGEPTVTRNGDISFSLAYKNTVINDSTDVYDLDPWYLPRIYALIVTGGTGSSKNVFGTKVPVVAAAAASGKLFDKWTGDVKYLKNETDSINEINMPAKDIRITASYKNKPVASESLNNGIFLFPNPATNMLKIILPEKSTGLVSIINSAGLEVLIRSINANEIIMDLTGIPFGIYIVRVVSEKFNHSQTIIVE